MHQADSEPATAAAAEPSTSSSSLQSFTAVTAVSQPQVRSASPPSSSSANNNPGFSSSVITSQRDRDTVMKFLKCTVCFFPCSSPIYSCQGNAHLCCGICREKMTKDGTETYICSICKTPLIHSAFAERLSVSINGILNPCPFVKVGCTRKDIPASKLKEHIAEECGYRAVKCLHWDSCVQEIPMMDYSQHLVNVHNDGIDFYDNEPKDDDIFIASYNLRVLLRANDEESHNYWSEWTYFSRSVMKWNEKEFVLCAARGRHVFYWWLVILGCQKEADKYCYETKLKQPEGSVKPVEEAPLWKLNVLPFHPYNRFDEYCGLYACESGARIGKFFTQSKNPDDHRFEFFIEVKLKKKDRAEDIPSENSGILDNNDQ